MGSVFINRYQVFYKAEDIIIPIFCSGEIISGHFRRNMRVPAPEGVAPRGANPDEAASARG